MATLTVYETDGTSRGTIVPVKGRPCRFDNRQAEDGTGSVTVNGDVTSTKLGELTVVRVNDGTADRFAFVPLTKTRREIGKSTEVTLEGPGVRWLLNAAQVYQEDTSDCALPADERWFGWMADAYDDTGWTAPASHGTWRSQPFPTARPENWPAPFAQYLWRTTDYDLADEDCLFRQTFTLAADRDVVLCISADDEYECWLDGTKLPLGSYGDDEPFQWEDYDQYPVKLCAGTHTFAVRGRNLERPTVNQNPAWVIWAFCEIAGDGKPAAQNAIWDLDTAATSGTFTVRPTSSATAATIDYDATASELQTALEALVGAGNVDVSGSAGDWTIEFIGAYANVSEGLFVNWDNLDAALTATETQRGGSAQTIAQSDPLDVVHYNPASSEPGMNPGEILLAALDEARARGVTILDDITDGFTATLDSNGNAWTFEINLPMPLPDSIHRLAVLLEEQGLDVWMDPDLTLHCAGEQGNDSEAVVTLTAGAGVRTGMEAVQEESTLRNVVRVRTEKGWVEVSDATSVTARGRWEAGLVLEGFETATAAEPHTNLLLNDLATPQRRTTFQVPSEGTLVPYADFGLGDRVTAPAFGTSGFASVAMRVIGITGEIEENSIWWTVELVD